MPVQPEASPASRFLNASAPPHWTSDALADTPHAFFGRRGGISTGIYASLNVGTGSRDDQTAVAENRRRIAAAFGQSPERLLGVHQVHSPRVVHVDAPWSGPRPEADALVSATPGLLLSILTADCAPVLFADARAGVIGAAHAGWKGAHAGVLENTVNAMRDLGARDIIAAIGPTIARDSYEIGPEFRERFTPHEQARFFTIGRGDRFFFDLPAYCVTRLQRAEVNRVEILGADTYSNPGDLFSHRRSVHEKLEDYGRNCAVVTLSQK